MEPIGELLERWRRLQGEKAQWHSHYDDLARVMLPRRLGFASTTVDGERRTDDIFDGTPMLAARGLANAIGGLIRPEGLPQVKMRVEEDGLNELDEVRDWLYQAETSLKEAFNSPAARFRQASGEVDQDLVVFGTAVMFVAENSKHDKLLFQSLHLRDATPFFGESGIVDGMFLKRRLTARQLDARFGRDKLSERTRERAEKTPDDRIDVLHAVIPRSDFKNMPLLAKNMPISDLWIEIDAKHVLAESGFNEFPFIVPRWDTSSGEDLGRSPGMLALPDADTLQSMGETILIAGQRAADPPLFAPNDGSFDAVNSFPGGLSYYDVETAVAMRGNPFFPLSTGTNLPLTRDMQQDVRQQIFAAFFKNVLNLPVEGPQMTAFEVNQRKEEFIREIGPIFGRLETDYTAPMVERAFMLRLRANGFPPIPEILAGRNLRFEYDSPVKRIRQQIEASAARLWSQEMLTLGQIKPEAIDLINIDELGRFSAEALGIPLKILNGADVVQQLRVSRQQAMQAQAQAESLARGLDMAKTGVETADAAGLIDKEHKAQDEAATARIQELEQELALSKIANEAKMAETEIRAESNVRELEGKLEILKTQIDMARSAPSPSGQAISIAEMNTIVASLEKILEHSANKEKITDGKMEEMNASLGNLVKQMGRPMKIKVNRDANGKMSEAVGMRE